MNDGTTVDGGRAFPELSRSVAHLEFDVARQGAQPGINVAFVISAEANLMDLAGPWEVFRDVSIGEGADERAPYRLYTVSDRAEPVQATGGLILVPEYILADAPPPRVISVGAQRGSPELRQWLREQVGRTEVLLSVCTGAFELGRAGILADRRATTHHSYWTHFAEEFPDVTLVRGRRFVDDGNIVTAAGLTSGIDAALHIVQRMFGHSVAERTAEYMEYDGGGWRTGERAAPVASPRAAWPVGSARPDSVAQS